MFDCKPNLRVALWQRLFQKEGVVRRHDNYELHHVWSLSVRPFPQKSFADKTLHCCEILPTKVDPLVSLMRVEKVPDATYDIGAIELTVVFLDIVVDFDNKQSCASYYRFAIENELRNSPMIGGCDKQIRQIKEVIELPHRLIVLL